MATYLHPGVYLEEIPSGAKPIEGVATSVAAFVGAAARGPAGVAILIQKIDDYELAFGEIASEDDVMGLAVQAFYLNGGKSAYICRLVGAGSSAAEAEINGQDTGTTAALLISAKNEGEWGNDVYFRVLKPDIDSLTFDLEIGRREDGEFVADETFSGLSMREDDENYALKQVNGNSAYVEVALGDAADSAEQYQNAVLTGGELPNQANYFSAAITSAMTLTLNINGHGTELITLNPAAFTTALSGAHNADGTSVAAEIAAAVHALGTQDYFQDFTCTYDNANRRFVLTSPESSSASSLEVFGGDLAKLLRLDSTQRATLTGAALANGATLFSDATAGLPSLVQPMTLVLDIDNHGNKTIKINATDLDLEGDNADDGARVALAIQNAVRAIDPTIPAYKDFTCEYTTARQFVLTSGSGNARASGVSVSDGPLADLLGLNAADTPTEVAGRNVEQGTREVIPLQTLGVLGQGTALARGVGNPPTTNDFSDFYGTILRKVRDVSIIVVPGQEWAADGSGNSILSTTLAHCETMKSRVLIIDPPEGVELDQAATVDRMSLPTSTYSVLYYPWVNVANPFYDLDTNPNVSKTVTIAPSAFAAGMWGKIDAKRGVWKAPAGVETQLLGVAGLEFEVEDGEQDQLNPLGVNCLRKIPSFGQVIWGSRTLSTKADPEWRYVPVRRTAIFIEQSIYNGIQWAVFEPNDYPLWGSLRANIGGFMDGLFRAGAFQGATAKDTYFVRCGLGDTMTQADIDRGQVIVIVGFAPLKPAEFVIVRIQQKVAQQ